MKLIIAADGSLTAELEPKSIKGAFDAIGQVRAFLIAEPCGCCQSKNTFPSLKTPKGYKYYQWECGACGAVFQFGQTQEGENLFPKRRDKDGRDLPHRGWSKYGEGQGGQAPGAAPGYNPEPRKEPQDYSQENDVPY